MERDTSVTTIDPLSINFNSHAHVERDGVFAIFVKFFTNFNSHAHVERDWRNSGKGRFEWISTHTLTWSVTERIFSKKSNVRFQLTRSRGA